MPQPAGIWLFGEAFFSSSNGEKLWSSDMWLSGAGPVSTSPDAASAASDFNDYFINSGLMALLGTDVTAKGTRVVLSNGSLHLGGAFYADTPGTGSDSALPVDQCAIVRLQTALTGRHGRGRLRIAGISENLAKGSHLTSTGLTGFSTWAGSLQTGFTSQGVDWKPCIVNRTAGTLEPDATLSAIGLLGTQRHRRPRF